jgi:hypothetical protein
MTLSHVIGCTPARRDPPTALTVSPSPSLESGAPAPPIAAPSSAPSAESTAASPPKSHAPEAPAGSATKRAGECADDRECRTASYYCNGCACVPVRRDGADPKCGGAKTACFVDPCRGKRAACRKGACVVVDEAGM